jgi:hypothetical protein
MAAFSDTTRAPAPLPYVHQPARPVHAPRTGDELSAEIGGQVEAKRAHPRGRIGRALASVWAGIEADAERTRKALGTLYGPTPG